MRAPLLLTALLLAGCIAQGPAADGEDDPALSEPVDATFRAALLSGEPIEVAALLWLPQGAQPSTILLAVHTVAGTRDNEWHAAPLPDYSLAERVAADGRAFVGIDLPGYGGSGGDPRRVTMNDLRTVVAQVAGALRGGDYEAAGAQGPSFERVVGAGYSLGSLVVQMAQAEDQAFDGVISLGWSMSHANPVWVACAAGAPCADDRHTLFHPPTTDAEVWAFINETHTRVSIPPFVETTVLTHRAGGDGPAGQDAYARRMAGPVLLVQGAEDWLWPDQESDPARYGPGAEVAQVILPETGHFVLHHRTRLDAHAAVATWLDARGL